MAFGMVAIGSQAIKAIEDQTAAKQSTPERQRFEAIEEETGAAGKGTPPHLQGKGSPGPALRGKVVEANCRCA